MSIVKAVDSYTAPNAAQLAMAKADGLFAWNGYLPGPGIDSTWTADDFRRIRQAGLHCIAYASQRADAQSMRELAAAWGVRGCLDSETGIEGVNADTQAWLDTSGFGLYHELYDYPRNLRAAFHILAAYQSDPNASWSSGRTAPPAPVEPHGWQWAGNVHMYGAHVDLCWFDQSVFVTEPTPAPSPKPITGDDEVVKVVSTTRTPDEGADPNGNGAVYLVGNWPYGPKRHVKAEAAAIIPFLLEQCGQAAVEETNAFWLDRIEDGAAIALDYVNQPAEPASVKPIPSPE